MEDMASHCRVLAAAVNASRHLNRTEETIRVNDLFERTCEMLEMTEHYTKHNLRHREAATFPWTVHGGKTNRPRPGQSYRTI